MYTEPTEGCSAEADDGLLCFREDSGHPHQGILQGCSRPDDSGECHVTEAIQLRGVQVSGWRSSSKAGGNDFKVFFFPFKF